MTRVAVISSIPAVKAGFERLLEGDREIELLDGSEAARGAEVALYSDEPSWRSLVGALLDATSPGPGIVLVTDDERDCRFLASRAAGRAAWGVLPHAAAPPELRAAVHAVAAGMVVLHPDLVQSVLAAPVEEGEELRELTEREREVLDLLAKGFSNHEIAGLLGISDHTVKFHTSSLYSKLGVANRTEAVRAGIRSGSISL